MYRALLSLLLLFALVPLAGAQDRTTVFAAASLSGPLQEIAQDTDVVFSFAGSGATARQVAAGAPADLVVLANAAWMDWLVEAGVAGADKAQVVAQNQLVVIAPDGSDAIKQPADLAGLLKGGRLAMGQRAAVPAGVYARQWLHSAGLWDALSAQLAETDNVRAALALVARAETPYGIVYTSDALAEPAVTIVYKIPADRHDAITYPAAALTPEGRAFLAEIRSPRGQQILTKHGFRGAP